MGGCGSTPSGCVKVGSALKNHRRSKRAKRRSHNLSKVKPFVTMDRSYSNPAFQHNEDSWFDTDTAIDSDCDDEFYSVQDDVSQTGSGTFSTSVTPRYSDQINSIIKLNEKSFGNVESNPRMELDDLQSNQRVFANSAFARCLDENNGNNDSGMFHDCGRLSSAFLPCLACTASSDETPGTRKRSSFKLSFKRREGTANSTLFSPRDVLRRPIAGSQVQCSPLEKKMANSWSNIDPNTFKVRGLNYLRDKKKESAPNDAAFYPFGVDVFLSTKKIDHIARFVELPAVDSFGEVPPILVVNIQIPLYPTALFQNECDGEGMNLVLYFKLFEKYSEELPVHFQENIKKLIDDEIEKIRGFPVDTTSHFRERLKILGRVANVDDLQLSSGERKLMNTYNEKPVLSRPQHEFYLGGNYFEIDLDLHRFSYIARKGLDAFQDKMKHSVLDFGLTIQGTKAEDFPEHMISCVRLKEIDSTNYSQLGF